MKIHLNRILLLLLFFSKFCEAIEIHRTNVAIHANQPIIFYYWLHVGILENNQCHWKFVIQTQPTVSLQSGESLSVDGEVVRKYAGTGMNCATVNLQLTGEGKVFRDYFQIMSNGQEYIESSPHTAMIYVELPSNY